MKNKGYAKFGGQIRCILGDVHKWRIHPLFVACRVKKDIHSRKDQKELYSILGCANSLYCSNKRINAISVK